ncbi:MAG: DUF4190 domain-containing protein [Planctomycetota bacterium]
MSHQAPSTEHTARLLNQYADFGAGDADAYATGPERTSVMAILSLVFGIVCVPFFGVLAVLLGILAFIGIGSSKGRVGGKGLAIGGILLGLLFTGLWIGVGLFGLQISRFYQSGAQRTQIIFEAIEAGDYTAAAAEIGTRARNLTPADFDAFRDRYREAYGAFVDAPSDWSTIAESWGDATQQLQNNQGQAQIGGNSGNQGGLPLAVNFENGSTLVIYEFAGADSLSEAPDPSDLIIILPDATLISLMRGVLDAGAPMPALDAPPESESMDESADDGASNAEPDSESGPEPGAEENGEG